MYYYLDGTVALAGGELAVIDCGGVGYACHTSLTTAAQLKQGERAKLFTYLYVREGVFDLYGFASNEELACFKLLLSVSGVGPKAALAVLSVATPGELALCVITGDEKTLTAASGVGKKMAQRILLELKDKMAKTELEAATADVHEAISARGGAEEEAFAALAVLGYSANEVAAALKKSDITGLSTEQIIKAALKQMMK